MVLVGWLCSLKMIKKIREEEIQEYSAKPESFKEYFVKLWQHKVLIWVFAKRDLKVKYAQTFLGISWSILQPLTALLIFSFFFAYILKWEADGLPYTLHILSGLLGWNFFNYVVYSGMSSVQESSHLIRKIYFPKSILPFSKVVVAGVELLLSFLILIPLMMYHGQMVSWKIVFLPFLLIFNALVGLMLVFWVAAFAYKKRDLFHLLPFVVYFGVWLTPVFFTNSFFPDHVQFILKINPMAHIVNLWRWMLFGNTAFEWYWILSFIIVFLITMAGMFFYNRRENEFSDFA